MTQIGVPLVTFVLLKAGMNEKVSLFHYFTDRCKDGFFD